MPSISSIVSLVFTVMSLLLGAGIWTDYLQNDWLLLGYASFLAGTVLAGISLLFKDRTWVGRLARWMPILILAVAFVAMARVFRGDLH